MHELESTIFENAIQQSSNIIIITDSDLNYPGPRILFVNDSFCKITGYTREEVLGKSPRIFQGPSTDKNNSALIRKELQKGYPVKTTLVNYRKDGSEYVVKLKIQPIKNSQGVVTNYLSIQQDISESLKTEKIIQKQMKYEIGLASISQLLQQPYNTEYILPESLEQIQLFSSSSSASLNRLTPDNTLVNLNASYKSKHIMRYNNLPIPKIWMHKLDKRLSIISYREGETDSEILKIYDSMDTHSLIMHPIQTENGDCEKLVILITDNSEERIWQDEDILFFRTCAHLLDSFLERSRYLEELSHHKERLEKLVEERTEHLQLALEKAEVANKAKNDFFSNISHELKTPLNSIMGFSKLIKSNTNEEDRIKYSDFIGKSASHLLSLINDILDISKLEADAEDFYLVEINLKRLLVYSMDTFLPQMEKKNLQFRTHFPEKEVLILGDEKRLRQIFLNLISNAIKFSNNNSDIEISIELEQNLSSNLVIIKIKDFGVGIEAKNLDKIFDKFTQLNDDQLNSQGTGLGLHITKILTEKLNGSISVSSQAGEWTIFRVIFPEFKKES